MKTQTQPVMTPNPKNLHQLVRHAAGNLLLTAVQRNSFMVNEVPREFQITTDANLLATILSNLLSAVVSHTKHSCIRIKAKVFDDIMSVYIKDNSSFSNYDYADNLEQVRLLAKKMNGSVSIRNMEDKFTTILFCFPNSPNAA